MYFSKIVFILLLLPLTSNAATSQCYGNVSDGRIEGSVKLPASGPNYSTYSDVASAAGRTYVHSSVKLVVESAFAETKKTLPNTVFVYGEYLIDFPHLRSAYTNCTLHQKQVALE